jgi:uncharacterized protein YbjT (DUF2867 family)
MRILLTGATGFIGSALAEALTQRGHVVVPVLRRAGALPAVQADFAQAPGRDWWRGQLSGIDAVVNAVGILREDAGRSFDALHARAPIELFHACAQVGVPVVVQVSALGAQAGATARYQQSKHAADEALRALPLRGAVVQPSLVYGPGGASAALFETMATAPLLPLPAGGRMLVQPVHLDDVIAGIVAVLEHPPQRIATLAFAGPRAMPLRAYLEDLRAGLGEAGPLRVVPVPSALFLAGGRVAGLVPSSFLDGETAAMLLAGNTATSNALPGLLGRAPRAPREFIQPAAAAPRRREAQLALWLPALRVALALLWIWTGIVSLGLYPVADSLALLARVGLHGAPATVALYGAALLDFALGVLCLAAPARWRHRVWLAQLVLVSVYTLLITIFLPEYWLHPYGPLSKNLPLLAAIALLWGLDRPNVPRAA